MSIKITNVLNVKFDETKKQLYLEVEAQKENQKTFIIEIPSHIVPQSVWLKYHDTISTVISQAKENITGTLLFRIVKSLLDENKFLHHYVTRSGIEVPDVNEEEITRELDELPESNPNEDTVYQLLIKIAGYKIAEKRKQLMVQLMEKEHEINLKSKNTFPIRVTNNVSCRPFPGYLIYTDESLVSDNLKSKLMAPAACECVLVDDCCCCSMMDKCHRDKKIAYTIDRKIKEDVSVSGIYECNQNCKCSSNCTNRVAQNGSHVQLEIFCTINDFGWGVRTRAPIAKSTFITRYVGELLDEEGAKERIRSKYIFGIGGRNDRNFYNYYIDAEKFGNIARFINHSCEPNVKFRNVYIESFNKDIHDIVFFAIRDIERGEQLCIDYGPIYFNPGNPCKCGIRKCKYKYKDKIENIALSANKIKYQYAQVSDGEEASIISTTIPSNSNIDSGIFGSGNMSNENGKLSSTVRESVVSSFSGKLFELDVSRIQPTSKHDELNITINNSSISIPGTSGNSLSFMCTSNKSNVSEYGSQTNVMSVMSSEEQDDSSIISQNFELGSMAESNSDND